MQARREWSEKFKVMRNKTKKQKSPAVSSSLP